eukprot:1160598-Pelagomonas_calceolata.AAC.4
MEQLSDVEVLAPLEADFVLDDLKFKTSRRYMWVIIRSTWHKCPYKMEQHQCVLEMRWYSVN